MRSIYILFHETVPGPSFGRLLIQALSLLTALSRILFSLFANFFAKCSSAPPAAILVQITHVRLKRLQKVGNNRGPKKVAARSLFKLPAVRDQ